MKRLACLCVLALAVVGCEHNEYEIAVTPKGRTILRKITVARVDVRTGEGLQETRKPRPMSPEELAHIAKIYKADVPKDPQDTYTFEGVFPAGPPKDVGGAGSYTHIDTLVGSVHYYVERFRGSDDQAGHLTDSFRATDEMVNLLAGWLESEFGREKQFGKLKQFIDRDVRNDFKNLNVILWTSANAPRMVNTDDKQAGEAMQAAGIARGLQYLVERDYLKVSDVPALFGALAGDDDGRDAAVGTIARMLARKAGITDKQFVARVTKLIADDKAGKESLVAYVRKTERYKARLAKWRKEKQADPDADQPTPDEVIEEMLTASVAAEVIFLGTHDKVTLRLDVPVKPMQTNGAWDEKAAKVTWIGHVKERLDLKGADPKKTDRMLPMICYALWCKENAPFQKTHFGKVVLSGKKLSEYCIWRGALWEGEGKMWDDFLASLKPGPKLLAKIEAFKFPPIKAPDGTEKPNKHAEDGIKKLSEAIAGPKKPATRPKND